ncbi:MAG TPA: hypothetical protein VN494_10370, partial [Patescibacteria group bacterium]|nr:hypothetical protein [Patescibacteria group bacterium]
SACATTSPTSKPDSDLPTTLARLQAYREEGRTGSVSGFFYLREPGVATPLTDRPVVLMPLTPELEATVQHTRQVYRAGNFSPLPFQALDQLKQALISYSTRLRDAGHAELIREVRTETGDDPKFEFRDVPEGRWLLLAELPSPPSLAVWVVPVTVTAGTTSKQSLNDQTVIEGLTQ